jgi:hypothetical protein
MAAGGWRHQHSERLVKRNDYNLAWARAGRPRRHARRFHDQPPRANHIASVPAVYDQTVFAREGGSAAPTNRFDLAKLAGSGLATPVLVLFFTGGETTCQARVKESSRPGRSASRAWSLLPP